MALLSNGAPFPVMILSTVGGGTLSLPGDLAGSYGVGVAVSALSVDDEETTAALVDKHPVAAAYSIAAIGRLVPEDVIGLVGHLRSQG